MDDLHKKLDNPVWFALSEEHRDFSINHGHIKFYEPSYCPFGATTTSDELSPGIEEYSSICNSFYMVGQKPIIPPSIQLRKELVCDQMMIDHTIDMESREKIFLLDNTHATVLFDLVNLVQPGYFKSRTHLLGRYYGIFKDNALVAVTGERMKLNMFTEVSAVLTHPEHTGRGFAKQLLAHTVNQIIIVEKKIPFLHVAESNKMAIGLYEKLGFIKRRKISFWNLEKIK